MEIRFKVKGNAPAMVNAQQAGRFSGFA